MKNLNQKDKRNRNSVDMIETKRFVLKNIANNSDLPKFIRWNASFKLSAKFNHNNSKISLNNRCEQTNRKSRLNKRFNYSRIKFRQLAQKGLIVGLKKASW